MIELLQGKSIHSHRWPSTFVTKMAAFSMLKFSIDVFVESLFERMCIMSYTPNYVDIFDLPKDDAMFYGSITLDGKIPDNNYRLTISGLARHGVTATPFAMFFQTWQDADYPDRTDAFAIQIEKIDNPNTIEILVRRVDQNSGWDQKLDIYFTGYFNKSGQTLKQRMNQTG